MFHSFIVPTLWLCDTQPFTNEKSKFPVRPQGREEALIHLPPCPPRTPQRPVSHSNRNGWLKSMASEWCFCWREVDFSTTLPKKKRINHPSFLTLFGLCDECTGMLLPSPQGAIVANKGLGWDPLPDCYWDDKAIPHEYIHIHMFQVQGPGTGIM